MRYVYDPYIMRRMAEGRIFVVNPQMPFEYFIFCFQFEKPFFFVSQLEDGRVAITPNVNFIPWNLLQNGFWPKELLPVDYEYVTIKDGTYPVILSAHPINNFEKWFTSFVRCVDSFAKQTLTDFIGLSHEFRPVKLGVTEEMEYLRKEKVLT